MNSDAFRDFKKKIEAWLLLKSTSDISPVSQDEIRQIFGEEYQTLTLDEIADQMLDKEYPTLTKEKQEEVVKYIMKIAFEKNPRETLLEDLLKDWGVSLED